MLWSETTVARWLPCVKGRCASDDLLAGKEERRLTPENNDGDNYEKQLDIGSFQSSFSYW